MITKSLDERATRRKTALKKRVHCVKKPNNSAEYQRKRKEAEEEAVGMVAAAEKEAAAIVKEAKDNHEEYVERARQFLQHKRHCPRERGRSYR